MENQESKEESTFTLDEIFNSVAEEEQHLSDIVYGGTNAEEGCTYKNGYLKRQAIYVCLSCTDTSKTPAGVCYNCSQTCHENHDILELYTKRQFRCDCGNSKFAEAKCSLDPNKEPLNERNVYGQNFQGLFCTCHRPYPDEEIEDDMFQCTICEDWFHQSHLDPKPDGEFDEMICSSCVQKYHFLNAYRRIFEKHNDSTVTSDEPVDVMSISSEATASSSTIGDDHPDVKRIKLNETNCQLKLNEDLLKNGDHGDQKCLYWPKHWRQKYLCTCDDCKAMYEKSGLSFLIDTEDSLSDYADKGSKCINQRVREDDQALDNWINNLPHVAASELAHKVVEFKTDLEEFFKSLGDKTTVEEKDVQKFFEDRKRKRDFS